MVMMVAVMMDGETHDVLKLFDRPILVNYPILHYAGSIPL
jgi:hypothetical protein